MRVTFVMTQSKPSARVYVTTYVSSVSGTVRCCLLHGVRCLFTKAKLLFTYWIQIGPSVRACHVSCASYVRPNYVVVVCLYRQSAVADGEVSLVDQFIFKTLERQLDTFCSRCREWPMNVGADSTWQGIGVIVIFERMKPTAISSNMELAAA